MILKERADKYAEENVNNILKNAFALAYADGYRDGYKDCEKEIQADLLDSRTQYVDLDLPSGTLWSSDFETENDNVVYLPFSEATKLSIPTKEQWNELFEICKWRYTIDSVPNLVKVKCVGPNGKTLTFNCTGKIDIDEMTSFRSVYFWIKGEKEG